MLRSRRELEDAAGEIHELLVRCRAPITARLPWWQAWLEARPDRQPFVVLARRGEELVGCLPLAYRRRAGLGVLVALGHGTSDTTAAPVLDADGAQRLGEQVRRAMGTLRRPWAVRLDQLRVGGLDLSAVSGGLRGAALQQGDESPAVEFGGRRCLEDHLAKRARGNLRSARRAMERDGLDLQLEWSRDPDRVLACRDDVLALRRRRDLDARGWSDLDTPWRRHFWCRNLERHLARGEVEVGMLHLSGRLAAYEVAFLDGSSYRVWDMRFEPELARYSPGRVLTAVTLERLLADERWAELDWMRGVDAHKRSTANVARQHVSLRAWGPRPLRLAEAGAVRAGLTRA